MEENRDELMCRNALSKAYTEIAKGKFSAARLGFDGYTKIHDLIESLFLESLRKTKR